MTKQNIQDIIDFVSPKNLSNISPRYKKIHNKKNPYKKRSEVIIPYYEPYSDIFLAMKSAALFAWDVEKQHLSPYLNGPSALLDFAKIFKSTPKEHQIYTAYSLSHELKITGIASNFALQNPDSSIFEIGCDIGLGALFYSNIAFNNIHANKPAYHLRSFEYDEARFKRAEEFKSLVEETQVCQLAKLTYHYDDGIASVDKLCSDGDIIFSSVAEPDICEGILEISKEKRIKTVISYTNKTNQELKRRLRSSFVDLFPDSYNIYPFIDKDYNLIAEDKRFGFIAIPREYEAANSQTKQFKN